jgi:uncharacterized protein YndB with AHSA1/START domain
VLSSTRVDHKRAICLSHSNDAPACLSRQIGHWSQRHRRAIEYKYKTAISCTHVDASRAECVFDGGNMAASAQCWPNDSRDKLLTLHLRARVSIEQRRLFHAFTLGEYLELWLIPAGAKVRSKSATGPGSSIEFISHGAAHDQGYSIKAIYYFLNEPSRIVIGWKKQDHLCSLETLLSIDLISHGDTTLLSLAQSGFDGNRSRAWHEAFWKTKVMKLQSIFSAHRSAMSRTAFGSTASRISRVL